MAFPSAFSSTSTSPSSASALMKAMVFVVLVLGALVVQADPSASLSSSSTCCAKVAGWCDGHAGVGRPGPVIANITKPDAIDCCGHCSKTSGCAAWVFEAATQTCSLLPQVYPQALQEGVASGVTDHALTPYAFPVLPLGSTHATGWLRDQLIVQAKGLAGHESRFWGEVNESVWIGGGNDPSPHEDATYWLNGAVPLGALLSAVQPPVSHAEPLPSPLGNCLGADSQGGNLGGNNPLKASSQANCSSVCKSDDLCVAYIWDSGSSLCTLKGILNDIQNATGPILCVVRPTPEAVPDVASYAAYYVNYILDHQAPSGWIGPDDDSSGNMYWPRFNALQAMYQYVDAYPTEAKRVVPAMNRFFNETYTRLWKTPLRSWSGFRWMDLALSCQWVLHRYPELVDVQLVWDLVETLHQQGVDWESFYTGPDFPTTAAVPGKDLINHGVNNGQAFKSAAVLYRQTGNSTYYDLSVQRMEIMDRYHGMPSGVFSGDEYLAGLYPSRGTELCNVVETMFSYETMFIIHGDVRFADKAERIAYNALPAHLTPNMWAHQYFQQANGIDAVKMDHGSVYGAGPADSLAYGIHTCCTANHPQGWPKFTAHSVTSTPDNGAAVVFYAPVVADMPDNVGGGGVSIKVDTNYPFEDNATISVISSSSSSSSSLSSFSKVDAAGSSSSFPLYVRIPGWANAAVVSLNGSPVSGVKNGTMHMVSVSVGSTVTVEFNPAIRLEPRSNGSYSVHRGALLYSVQIPHNMSVYDTNAFNSVFFELFTTGPWAFALQVDPAAPEKDMEFVNTHQDLTSIPFNTTVADSRFIKATVRPVDGSIWPEYLTAAGPLPQSPVCAGSSSACGNPMVVKLVPYGSTNLRLSVLPIA